MFLAFYPMRGRRSRSLKSIRTTRSDGYSSLKESGARQIAPCPVAKWCGGCQLQIVKYEAQCEFKDQWMARLFKQERLYPILKAKEPLFYRNKAQFPIQLHDGARKMGFYKRHSNEIVDTNECLIQNDGINRIYSFCMNI